MLHFVSKIQFYSSNRYWAVSAYLGSFIPDEVTNSEPQELCTKEIWFSFS